MPSLKRLALKNLHYALQASTMYMYKVIVNFNFY